MNLSKILPIEAARKIRAAPDDEQFF